LCRILAALIETLKPVPASKAVFFTDDYSQSSSQSASRNNPFA
jgi:hypothetical protein